MKIWRISILAVATLFFVSTVGCFDEVKDKLDETFGDLTSQPDQTRTPDDDAVGQPDDVGECQTECETLGQSECVDGTSYRTCTLEGVCQVWSTSLLCPEEQDCNAETGQCEMPSMCQNECANVGIKTCSNDGNVVECKVDDDGCNVLAEVEICEEGKNCVNGECIGGGGENDCLELVKCSGSCTNDACVQQCAQSASQAGVEAYNSMSTCAQGSCADVMNKPAAQSLCIVQSCPEQWTGCVGPWGSTGCMAMLQCAQGCGANAACQTDCLVQGTQVAQVNLWIMQACLEENCTQCGQDQNCFQTCAQEHCMQEVMACQSA
jgi:hypothetical protein